MSEKISIQSFAHSLSAAIEGEDSVKKQQAIEYLTRIMCDGIWNKEFDKLHEIFQSGSNRIEAWGNSLEIGESEYYQRVFAYSAFWMSEKLSQLLYQKYFSEKETVEKIRKVKTLKDSRYFLLLMEALERKGEMSEGAIAKELGMTSKEVSCFLYHNERYALWEKVKFGERQYYHLTWQGRQYLSVYRKHQIEQDTNELSKVVLVVIECLLEELNCENPDYENVIHKVNLKLGKGQILFENELLKVSLRRVVRSNAARREKLRRKERYQEYINSIEDLTENDYKIFKESNI